MAYPVALTIPVTGRTITLRRDSAVSKEILMQSAVSLPESQKFSELLLYVSRLAESDPRCGATKLNKILFYADFSAYRALGRSISGQTYRKLQHGPAPWGVLREIERLSAEGACGGLTAATTATLFAAWLLSGSPTCRSSPPRKST